MPGYRKLLPEELAWRLDESRFDFHSTFELKPEHGTIGQERARKALDFGLGIKSFGYNLYVLGQTGTGREFTVKRMLEEKSKEGPVPSDWLYLMNFVNPDKPRAVNLPRGKGSELAADMDRLVEQLKKAIPRAFEGEEFEKKREDLLNEHNIQSARILEELDEESKKRGFSLEKSPRGLGLVPMKKDGTLMSQEEFAEQPPEERQRIEKTGSELQDKLADAMRKVREQEKLFQEKLNGINREFGMFAVGHYIDELEEKYGDFPNLRTYFEEVRENVLENLDDFKVQGAAPQMPFMQRQEPSFERYRVNLLVDNANTSGAPVVFEPNPTFNNLFGRIEQKVQFGVATTDFNLIKSGAFHRANGGFLVIDVMDLVRNPFSYEGLKRALKNRVAAVEDALEQYRMMPLYTLKPEPIPLDVKVLLIGPPFAYYMLNSLDEEFGGLFKVHVDFDNRHERNDEVINDYVKFIAEQCREEGLKDFAPSGVARVIEHSARVAADKEKLTLKLEEILDLLRESSYWAVQAGAVFVEREHVDRAIGEGIYRSNMLEEKIRQAIDEGIIMVDVKGEVAGQINGLSVLSLGGYAFGRPSRITARTYMGHAGMVNIEREVKMSGPIHDKGVMILTGFLGQRYAYDKPLTLSASIAFEQSYEGIEGDSASSTELYALLSSISGVPVKQGIAVTGSVNQRGEVQPIGGVNEKVEGYFEVCKVLGLTGEQGVIIPESNVRHLMLKDEVVHAVRDGRFHIWAVKTIDEGMEVLTGMPAGEQQEDGKFPPGTLNYLADEKLRKMAQGLKEFAAPEKGRSATDSA